MTGKGSEKMADELAPSRIGARRPRYRGLALAVAVMSVVAVAGCRPTAASTAAERAAAERAAAREHAAAKGNPRVPQREPGKVELPAPSVPAVLVLEPGTVVRSHAYQAIASLFWPGEQVTFSWSGPTSGIIGTAIAGLDGQATMTVWEYAAPAGYLVTATGMTSGRTAFAELRVVA